MAGQIERWWRRSSPGRAHQVAAARCVPTLERWPVGASGSRMLSTGTWIFRSSGLRTPASTTWQSRPAPTRKRPTSSSGRWVADRPIRWSGRAREVLEALEGERQVGAALGARDRVDLVHDHRLGVHEELARPRGEHQVERLRGGDEDVGRRAQHRLALLLRRVAGADRDGHVAADALERSAEVLLDVVGERLQRRDVDQPRPASVGGLRHEPVERPEERGERLARPRGGGDEHVAGPPRSRARPSPAPP